MGRFQQSVEVNASVQACFDQWMKFESFPSFMKYVKSVTRQGNGLWHWVVSGPLGAEVEWDAQMDGRQEDRMISWHTLSGGTIDAQGAVMFESISPTLTRITSTFQYEPPVGALGELVAQIFSNPEHMVKEDLQNFKKLIEGQRVMPSSAY